MSFGWRQALVAVAVVAGFGLAGFGISQLAGFRAPAAADLAVEQRLMCPQCQGVRLDVCDRPICDDMRADIRRRLAGGESPDSIVSGYEVIYGPTVLASAGAFDNSAPVPWLFVLAGLLVLASLAVGRGSVGSKSADAVSAEQPADAPSAASPVVDREMAAWRAGR